MRQMISSEPLPTQGNRLETIEEEFAKSVKLSIYHRGASTPADRIRAPHAVMKMLLQSPSLERPVDAYYVERGCKGTKATAAERTTFAALVNLSRPLVPKRRMPCSSEDLKTKERVGGYTYKAEAHKALRAQFLVLANDSFDTGREAKKKRSPAAIDRVQELAEEEFTKAELNLEEAESKLKVLRSELEPLREARAESSWNKKRLARRRRQGDKHAMISVASWIPTGPN
ncbi:hypothetical protein KI688_004336 [Linnemannia hyalina]|uniref:Uncharacterized protein n=1 Tax=Linnemannia hyalina TaxID=64524 RepID=A0A9P7XMY1_9FUNG|nr:hypothetical protein KI688_004336 [Linnemannia hyalina]